jgi:uncharacterized protein DUF4190
MMIPGAKVCPACGAVTESSAGMPGFLPASEQLPGTTPAATTRPKSTNGLAIASMVLGIVWVYWIGSILALIFGYVAKGQIAASGGAQGGRGMAIAGIVLGWVGIGVLCLGIVALVLGAGAASVR